MRAIVVLFVAALMWLATVACSQRSNQVSYKTSVEKALEQADLKGIDISEDKDKNTITLTGKLHSEEAKRQAGEVAQAAVSNRTVINQISVQPVGMESQARAINSNLDSAIEKNYKAALIARGLDKEDIRFDVKNGVLMLKGEVKSPQQKEQAEQIAMNIPNVAQVLNQIEVNR